MENWGRRRSYDRLFKRKVFDFPGWPLNAKGRFELRDEGKGDLSFKQRLGIGKENWAMRMEEIEITVSDFEKPAEIFTGWGWRISFMRRTEN
jgi:hypothetical protein